MENKNDSKTRGRPRSFDINEAVRKAAPIFWDRGYEGTSVDDLTQAMGITTQSLYAAFGSKSELYKRALNWYQQEVAFFGPRALSEESDVIIAIERTLLEMANQFTLSGRPRGCMRSTAMIRYSAEHKELAEFAAALRQETFELVKARLDKGVADGQLRKDTDTPAQARFINALVAGMSVAAQDGATAEQLQPFAGMAVRSIEEHRTKRVRRKSGQRPYCNESAL